jgi:TRAP-type uncharacterized transport system fused permease subunit
MSIVAFIVPFSFAYGQELLLQGNWWLILPTTLSALFGTILLALSLEGYWKRQYSRPARALIGFAGLVFLAPALFWSIFF